MTTHQQLWQAVLGELELNLSKANFTTWFRNTGITAFENNRVVVSVPTTFVQSWIEKKYHKNIVKILRTLTENEVKEVLYKVETIKQQTYKPKTVEVVDFDASRFETTPKKAQQKSDTFVLNQKYHFQNFIVGKNSELAHAASQAVAKNPGTVYNPLFIYGGVGLGKTHLAQAIGNYIVQINPDASIIYASCEKFTNDFIHLVKEGKAQQFQQMYRNADILLIDDIQFISGKKETQEAFFHTFNALHQQNKQIVITSDRPPKAIESLEERLQSRFESGLIADVSYPDIETRIAILEAKCQDKQFELEQEVLSFLAEHIHENVRELEGALNRIIAQHQLQDIQPSMETVKNMLAGIKVSSQSKVVTSKDLIDIVARFYGISETDILGASRKKSLVIPRQIVMYLLREELGASFPQIGQDLGGRDHTTAMHAHGKICKVVKEDEELRQQINSLRQKMYRSAHS